ncbi:hypothetical protein MA16_Dca027291 [Dendrobium catenatum]|uniref:Reverse transcriptase zinc-binding domain-containing protein n=1 Tax=Dendrobium catenatum TaxID=906689 RepID=A0A2I0V7B9_9ASPA|nr:hypothetical protein MA16_Dca027291 [Dendrobium catenatum]
MAVIGKLKTADNLNSRGIAVPLTCSLCLSFPKNHSHLFFGCEFSFTILTRLLPELNCFLLRPTLLQIFYFFDHSTTYNRQEIDFCCLIVSYTIYHLWRERNSRRFSNENMNSVKIINNISTAIRLKVSKWKNKERLLGRFFGL